MEKVKGKNAVGLYTNKLKNNDIVYYYTLKIAGKVKWFKVGTKSNGFRVEDAKIARTKKYNEINHLEKKDVVAMGRKKGKVLTFDDLFNKYYEYNMERKLKTKSYWILKRQYNFRVKKHLGHIPMDILTTQDIEKMTLANKNDKKMPISLSYLDSCTNLVRTVLNHAINNDLYDGNDLTKKITRYCGDNARLRYLNKDEIQLLLDTTKQHKNKNVYMCALLALLTGARINVVTHIKIKDIDIENKTIKLFDEKGKTNKHYYGYINDKYVDIIKEHMLNITDDKNSNEFILNYKVKNIKQYYQDLLRPILNELFNKGLEKTDTLNRVVVHTLRHTFGSQLVINGVDIYTVQKLMNHSNISMTMRYAKLNDQIKKDSVNKMDW
jgi:integrase